MRAPTKSKLSFPPGWLLPSVLGVALLPRFLLAWFEHGVNHPDEVFQTLEPAHRWVYGYGILPWEFQDGARSWLLPGLLALFWKVLALLGFSDPLTIVPILRLPFVALAIYAAYLSARLAKNLAGEVAGIVAALLSAFCPLALLLDFRTTTEAASGAFVALAVLAIVEGRAARSGAWAALLVFLRPTNCLVGMGAVLALCLERRFRDVARFCLGALPVALAGGLLDWITWGSPFHYLVEYYKFNWQESGAEMFGAQAIWGYASWLLPLAPLIALALLPAAVVLVRASGAARTPVVVGAVYLLVLSALAHKEPRFLLPVLPVLAAIAAAGVALLVGPWAARHVPDLPKRSTILIVASAAIAVFGLQKALRFTFADLGDPRGEPSDRLLLGRRNAVNHLLVQAGDQPDLCGMLVLGLMPNELFSGGTTYLHRDVLLTSPQSRQLWMLMSRAANYAVADKSARPPGWQPVAGRDDVALLKRDGGCMQLPEEYRPKLTRPTKDRPKSN